jgi:esterase/lipase superfamily enzyme
MDHIGRRPGLRAAALCLGAGLLPGCTARFDGTARRTAGMAAAARNGCDPDLHADMAGRHAWPPPDMRSRPRAIAAPAPTEVFFATNRAPDRNGAGFTDHADPAGASRLLLGAALIGAATSTEARGAVLAAPRIRGLDDFAGPRAAPDSASAVIRDYLRLAAARGAMPLIFVHGIWSGFEATLSRAAQIAQFYADARPAGLALAPLAFCWPSADQGSSPASYRAERAAAARSGIALARLLRALAAEPQELRRPLRLLSHSTGVWVLQHALQALRADGRAGLPEGLFRAAVLAAGDADADALSRDDALRPLATLAETVTVAVNPDDFVLSLISGRVLGNGPRLGVVGAPPGAALPRGAMVVDYARCLPTHRHPRDDDPLAAPAAADLIIRQHQYYRNAPRVRDDLALALRGDVAAVRQRRIMPGQAATNALRRDPFYFYAE